MRKKEKSGRLFLPPLQTGSDMHLVARRRRATVNATLSKEDMGGGVLGEKQARPPPPSPQMAIFFCRLWLQQQQRDNGEGAKRTVVPLIVCRVPTELVHQQLSSVAAVPPPAAGGAIT